LGTEDITAIKPPETEVKAPETEVKAPETQVKPPQTEVKTPEMDVKSPQMGVKAPETEVKAPENQVKPPETEVKVPEAQVKAPETDTPNGRTTHADEPEVEPGVVAQEKAADGHDIKVLKDNPVVRCSSCDEIRNQYKEILEQNPALKQRLDDIENIKDADEKAQASKQFENELSQIRQAGQPEQVLNVEQVLNAVKSRIASQSDKFDLTYTKDQLESIIKKGKELGLSDKVIEDLIYTGSRKAKAIQADELIGQMEHWVNVINKRGFPEKFANLEEFQQFSQDLLTGVKQAGIPADDIRIQGSSLRKPDAQDVDIAAFVDERSFDNLLIQRYHEKIIIKESNEKVSLNNKSHDDLVKLANDIAANPQKYNAQGGTFQNALLNGIISSKSDIIKPLKNVRKEISAKYPHLNVEAISVLIKGGRFDVKPDLPVTGVKGD
jgi:hypothetical protein